MELGLICDIICYKYRYAKIRREYRLKGGMHFDIFENIVCAHRVHSFGSRGVSLLEGFI